MFDFIRTHRRWMQFILLLLIVPSFMVVGVSSYETFVNREPELADVGEQQISRAEFDAAHRNQLEQMRQRLGSRFDAALVDTPAMRRQLLDDLIDQRLLAQVAADNRFSVSDGALRNTIAAIPQVQDNGRFSPERYRQVLAAQGLTPTSFEAGLRRDLAVSRVLDPVSATSRLPASVVDGIESAFVQQRTVQTRVFAAADYRDKVQVSQQDIQAWYDANKQQLEVPEQVQAQYLVLDEAAASQGVTVSDADVDSYYKQNQSRFGQPERRRLSHILIQVAPGASEDDRKQARQRADQIAKQAAANPAGFADLARKESQDAGSAGQGGDLGWVVPPTLQQAAGALSKDQVSGVVETPAGFHVLKVTDFQAGAVKPLAEVKDQITAEIRKQLASARFADMATSLTKLVYDQRDSLQPAADALNVKLRTASGITRTGLLPAGQSGADAASASPDAALLDNPRVRQTLYSPEVLRDKANSGVIELAPDTMLAVRVQQVKPAHVPPLAEVQDSIRQRLVSERAAQAARQAGEAALKALQEGTQAGAAPEGFGEARTLSRQDPGQTPRPLLEAIMGMTPPAEGKPGYAGVAMGPDYTVVRLERVAPGTVFSPEDHTMLSSQLSSAWGAAEQDAVVKLLRQQYEVKVLPAAEPLMQAQTPDAG
ncbi:SurA N-terminal domain-containing protein [Bordetella genomosp. 13]|uniref:Periplasmic chaperone PpiD n=1 Tax=Bordetella genomosp. 13 TaxID=463040 RepID=A0A1W6ZEU3_9BORD|nr:SurA N-terminal domain-containing protein [Bordetella genomosp. 13]ARP95394.1 peptidylprolyl isomerase [Bordetella genomosp. 13]